MPRQHAITEARIYGLIACLTPAVTLLDKLDDTFGPPFIRPIVKTVQALITGVQNVKRNKGDCFHLVESIHQVLYPIIRLHLKAETAGSLSPSVLDQIAQFTETLHKIYPFIEIQQDGNKIKQFFHQSEVNKLLKNCRRELDQAIEVFKVQAESTVFNKVIQVQYEAETMHKELLELVATLSVSDRCFTRSSTSFSLLPSKPKIFHGRDSELKDIIAVLSQDAPRIAILGGGGMGKTSLARAALHYTDTCAKFPNRFFVSAEAATTAVELAALVGLHLGLEPGKDITKLVVQYFAQQSSPCLLVLDNLETPWEPTQSRGGVENFLSLLTDMNHLALIITMRGSERPGQPLSDHASRQIFEEITDDPHASKEKTQLLAFTENMPLAVDLMAHLVDYEGLDNVLARWKTEKTAVLSTGYGRTSNLDASIALSCSSPRITPGARELLSLLSILPDGLSDVELTQSNLPISNIRKHRDAHLGNILPRITANLANLEEVLHRGLQSGSPELSETIQCILSLNSFFQMTRTGDGGIALLGKIPIHLCDHRMSVLHIIECLKFQADTGQLITQGISHLQHLHDPVLEARFYAAAGGNFFDSQPTSQQLEFLEKGLELSKSIGDSAGQCDYLLTMAYMKWRIGDYIRSLAFCSEAQQLAYQTTDLFQVSKAMYTTSASLTALGDYVGSLTQLNRARELLNVCGLTSGCLYHDISNSQAEIHLQKSEYAEARSIHVKTLQNTLLDPNSPSYAITLRNISEIDVLIGATKETVHLTLNRARKIFTDMKIPGGIVYCDMISARLDFREGNETSTRILFHDCLKLSWRKNDMQLLVYCLERLADGARWPNIFHQHIKWPVLYLCQAHKSSAKLAVYKALQFIGELFITMEEATAHSLFTVALEGFTSMNVHRSRAQCILRLGDLAQKKGETTEALKLWISARPLFKRALQAQDVTKIDTRLATLKERLHAPTIPFNEDTETSKVPVMAAETRAVVV
ncbi:hypothetical protein B0H16DRAFT_1793701 [Mycena metata]|uniref:Novel STAND NTPase 1 domain-containing protein n=1 Tax=Mycena metata TaxID=1033252 RepID=A0AAD7HH40_9AGAR|nr:hypothetical protein B0H16DRAFT_1793701 [Mycena metata]